MGFHVSVYFAVVGMAVKLVGGWHGFVVAPSSAVSVVICICGVAM